MQFLPSASFREPSWWRSIEDRFALAPAMLFLAVAWGGFFAVVGGFLLAGAAVAIATAQQMRPSLVAFSAVVILSAPVGGLLAWKAQAGPLILRLFITIVLAAAATGAAGTLMVFDVLGDPIAAIEKVAVHFSYSTAFALLLFVLLWSLRGLVGAISQVLRGPERRAGLLRLHRGLIGSALAAAFAGVVAIASEGQSDLVWDNWFYVLVMPCLIAFGFGCPPSRRRSIPFAAIALVCAAGVGFAAYPLYMLPRHWVPCTQFWRGAGHTVLTFEGEPWTWSESRPANIWLMAPIALVELTFWHVFDPVTEADCSTG